MFVGAALLVLSWRATIAAWTVVGLASSILAWRLIPDAAPAAPAARAVPAARTGRVRTAWPAIGLALVGGAGLAVHGGFYAILPTLLVATGSDPAAAAAFAGWTRATGMAGALAGGWTADRHGRTTSLVGWFLLTLAGALVLPLTTGWPQAAAIIVMTVAACAAVTASYALLGDVYTSTEVERLFGPIVAGVSLIGGVATPLALSLVLEHAGVRAALATVAAAPVLGFIGVALCHAGCASGSRTSSSPK